MFLLGHVSLPVLPVKGTGHASCRSLRSCVLFLTMQSSDEADNSGAPKARAKAAKGLRGRRSWMLRIPKRGSAEAEDVVGPEAAAADPSSKSMTEGSTRSVLHPAACHIIDSCSHGVHERQFGNKYSLYNRTRTSSGMAAPVPLGVLRF